MTIQTIYKVSVEIPEDVYREFGHSPEYERETIAACSGHIESWEDAYSDVFQVATFYTRAEAELCEKRLSSVIGYFQSKLE